MSYLRFLWLSIRLSTLHHVRYPVEWVSNYIGGIVLLSGALLGGKAAFQVDLTGKASAVLFAFVAITALQAPLKFSEGRTAEVEEIYLYRMHPAAIVALYGIGSSVVMYLNLFALLLGLTLILGLPWAGLLQFGYYLVPTFICMAGLGLGLAGLQLVVKRLGSLPNLFALLLLTAAFSPPEMLKAGVSLIPVTQAFLGVQGFEANQTVLWIGAFAFAVAGWMTFGLCERLMRRWGTVAAK